LSEPLTVLVTGGAGFIGSHLVDALVERGYYVRIFDNFKTGKLENILGHLKSGDAELVRGSITEIEHVEKVMRDVDYVYHLAAKTSVPQSLLNPSRTFNVNVSGTVNLLRVSSHAKVKKFIFGSSCAVYGDPYTVPVSEAEPADPISPYAESKMAGEQFCLGFYKTGLLKTVMPRFFNVYGPRTVMNEYAGVIVKFIENSKKEKPLIVYGDGTQTRDFISVFDLVHVLIACLDNENVDGKVFNLGTGKPTTIQDLANIVLELSGSKSKIKNVEEREGDIKHSHADITKAKKLIGFDPKISIKDGLKELII
jgi:UDP-glucose 4-epimerase